MHTLALIPVVGLAVGLLGACGSDDGGGGGNPFASGSELQDLLDRFTAPDDLSIQIDFSADAQLRALVDPDTDPVEDPWAASVSSGAPNLYSAGFQDLGIALDAAQATILVGMPPASVGLVVGGQDADAIAQAAEDAGWTADDDGVLVSKQNVDEPLSLQLPQLRPDDDDLVYGGEEADLSLVDGDGPTLADHPILSSLAACLDDVLVATFAAVEETPVAIGAAYDSDAPDRPRTIICAAAESEDDAEQIRTDLQEAVESGESLQNALPYSKYFTEPESEVLDEQVPVAKLEAVNAEGRPAMIIRQMLAANDLPGLQVKDSMTTPSDSDSTD